VKSGAKKVAKSDRKSALNGDPKKGYKLQKANETRAHATLSVAPVIYPRALSITQGRAVGITHYLLGGIVTTWAFFQARLL
jgi:hypothetical protein